MSEYLIYFNQQWVGEHPEEWFDGRRPLVRALVTEIRLAVFFIFTGGLEEDGAAYSADATSGEVKITRTGRRDLAGGVCYCRGCRRR